MVHGSLRAVRSISMPDKRIADCFCPKYSFLTCNTDTHLNSGKKLDTYRHSCRTCCSGRHVAVEKCDKLCSTWVWWPFRWRALREYAVVGTIHCWSLMNLVLHTTVTCAYHFLHTFFFFFSSLPLGRSWIPTSPSISVLCQIFPLLVYVHTLQILKLYANQCNTWIRNITGNLRLPQMHCYVLIYSVTMFKWLYWIISKIEMFSTGTILYVSIVIFDIQHI